MVDNRRVFLKSSVSLFALFPLVMSGCDKVAEIITLPPPPPPPPPVSVSLIEDIGPLQDADANGLKLPSGFTSRVIANTGSSPSNSSAYIWHDAPDGGDVFETSSGGWIYVSNSETSSTGGVGALEFDANGEIIDAYSILDGTVRNCAGGKTPWDTWLSCEEWSGGNVWECDPFRQQPPIEHFPLGTFHHEGAAYDTKSHFIYLTEDRVDGCLYRFESTNLTADGFADLSAGILYAAIVNDMDMSVTWAEIPDPNAVNSRTRLQIPEATKFKGGEGVVYYENVITFATKFDNKIWDYNTQTDLMSVRYDFATSPTPILKGVDNITLSKDGDLLVAEDGGEMKIVAITIAGTLIPIAQFEGHDSSEVTGPAFSPDGKRLYFSSQRGTVGTSDSGITYEVTGPFHS